MMTHPLLPTLAAPGSATALLEALDEALQLTGTTAVPIAYISASAAARLGCATTSCAYLDPQRKEAVLRGQSPFGHDAMLAEGRLVVAERWEQVNVVKPCVVLVPAVSLLAGEAAGRAVQLQSRARLHACHDWACL
jgi:hypothetical protein